MTKEDRSLFLGDEVRSEDLAQNPLLGSFPKGPKSNVQRASDQIDTIMADLSADELDELREELRQKELFDWLEVITIH